MIIRSIYDIDRNDGFTQKCALCGAEDYTLSEIIFRAGYGSKYDGETHTIRLCGECFDFALDAAYIRVLVARVEVDGE